MRFGRLVQRSDEPVLVLSTWIDLNFVKFFNLFAVLLFIYNKSEFFAIMLYFELTQNENSEQNSFEMLESFKFWNLLNLVLI